MSIVHLKKDVGLDWNPLPYVDKVRDAMETITRQGAEYVEETAKRNLERMAPDSTGTLASQIELKTSAYPDGGHIVQAQGPGNYNRYYASFVELGTSKMQGLAYLRKALRRGKFYIRAKLKKYLECEVGS